MSNNSSSTSTPPETEGHEKYAVAEDDQLVKQAKVGVELQCPLCGLQAALTVFQKANVLSCPTCGTKPFEPAP